MNCGVAPTFTLELAGVTRIETSAAWVTVRTVEPVTPPKVALMVEVPTERVEAFPVESIVATLGVADAHVTDDVRFWVELSE